MRIWEKIKEAWPLVTKARFNRMKGDRNALLKEHKNMSDYVLALNEKVSKLRLVTEKVLAYNEKITGDLDMITDELKRIGF